MLYLIIAILLVASFFSARALARNYPITPRPSMAYQDTLRKGLSRPTHWNELRVSAMKMLFLAEEIAHRDGNTEEEKRMADAIAKYQKDLKDLYSLK